MATNAKGAAQAQAAKSHASGAAAGGDWGNQANYDQQPDGTYKSRVDGSVIPADQYWNLQAQQQQARQTGQASIDAYNKAQPGFVGQLSNAGQAILPMAVGGLTGGPWGAAVGALGTIKVLDSQGQKEAATNQGVQAMAAAQVDAQRKAAGTYVTPYGTPNQYNPSNQYVNPSDPASRMGVQPRTGGTGSTSSPLTSGGGGSVPGLPGTTADISGMLKNYQGGTAPNVNAASLGPASQATAERAQSASLGPMAQAQAQNAQAANIGPMAQAAAERAQAQYAGATNIDPAAQAAAQRAAAERSGYTNMNLAQSNQTRAQQQSSIGDLFAASRGLVPSAAEIQLKQATDRNVANQMALAAALQGRSTGGALRQASSASGAINAQAAGDAAALRANEQASARGLLANTLSGVRGQDIGTAESQANLTQGVNLANAQMGTNVNMQNAALGTNVNLANMQATNARAQAQAQLQQQRLLENAQLGTQTSQFNAGLGTQNNQFNAGQSNVATMAQAQMQQQAALQNAQIGSQVGMFNAGQTNTGLIDQAQMQQQAALQNAALGTQNSQFNAGQSNNFAQQQAQLQQQAALANADNQLRQQGLNDQQRAAILQAMVASKGQDLGFTSDTQRNNIAQQLGLGGLNIQQQQLALAASAQNWGQAKDVIGAVGTLGAGVGSSQWFQNLLGGKSSNSSVADVPAGNNSGLGLSTYYPGDSSNYGSLGADDYSDIGIADGGT